MDRNHTPIGSATEQLTRIWVCGMDAEIATRQQTVSGWRSPCCPLAFGAARWDIRALARAPPALQPKKRAYPDVIVDIGDWMQLRS
jgi:hypothetical protein